MFGLNPWLLLAVVIVFGASNAGSYWYGTNVGAEGERVEWQKRENQELAAANKRIVDLTETVRAKESMHAVELANISAQYQKELQDEKSKADRVIADVRAGARKLRIPVASTYQACGSGEAGKAPAAPFRRDGEARAELSASASSFLIGLANEADQVVRQLTACQAIIMQDRKDGPMIGH